MWVLATLIFAACKWLTWRGIDAPKTPIRRHIAYLFAWPGLDEKGRKVHSLGRKR